MDGDWTMLRCGEPDIYTNLYTITPYQSKYCCPSDLGLIRVTKTPQSPGPSIGSVLTKNTNQ